MASPSSLCFHRPGSVPSTGRKDKGQRRPASGAVACNGRTSPTTSGKLELAITGTTSLPCMIGVGAPELRVCNLSGTSGEPVLIERAHSSKMMGVLAATVTGPLKDCTSFRRLRDATAQLSSPTQSRGQQRPSNHRLVDEAPGASHDAASFVNGDFAVRQAMVSATTRQCCRLLRKGWETVDAASLAVPILAGLKDDGLLNPLIDVQSAALDSLLDLFSKTAGSAQRFSKPKPGSFAAWTEPEASQGDLRAKATVRPLSAFHVDVQRWVQEAKVFGRLAELNLLPQKGLDRAHQLLEAELRRILRAPTPQELRRVAQHLAEGGFWIARANAAHAERRDGGCTIESPEKSDQARHCESLANSVKEIVVIALRTSTESDRDGPAAMAAREALQRCGLVDVNDEFPDSSTMIPKGPMRSSSAPEFCNALPGLHRASRRGDQAPTVLESGIWQLEAARAIIRDSRVSPARGAAGGRR